MKKKKTVRSQTQFPALNPKLNLKTRNHLIETEYLKNLPENWTDPKTGKVWTKQQLLQYVNDFNTEFVNADFTTNVNEGRKRIHKKKKSEHAKNNKLKQLEEILLQHIKNITTLVNEAQINIKTKHKIKRIIKSFKIALKKQIKDDFKFINDTYKKKAEDANNARNNDIYTAVNAQGKLYLGNQPNGAPNGIKVDDYDVEDQLIEKIDSSSSENDAE